jgi:hypothetical protein
MSWAGFIARMVEMNNTYKLELETWEGETTWETSVYIGG